MRSGACDGQSLCSTEFGLLDDPLAGLDFSMDNIEAPSPTESSASVVDSDRGSCDIATDLCSARSSSVDESIPFTMREAASAATRAIDALAECLSPRGWRMSPSRAPLEAAKAILQEEAQASWLAPSAADDCPRSSREHPDQVQAMLQLASMLAQGRPQGLKSWWELLEPVEYFPVDCGMAIRFRVEEAYQRSTCEASVSPVVSRLLNIAISCFDKGDISADKLKNCAMMVCKRYKPEDLVDKLQEALNAAQTTAAGRSRAPVKKRSPSSQADTVCLGPEYSGDARIQEKVAEKCHKPWFELIEEIRCMKPNNGFPIKVNIFAAIMSATSHPLFKSPDAAKGLRKAFQDNYCRKSCGATKQAVLKILCLLRTKPMVQAVM